jgi:hypothetical protein
VGEVNEPIKNYFHLYLNRPGSTHKVLVLGPPMANVEKSYMLAVDCVDEDHAKRLAAELTLNGVCVEIETFA